MCGKCLPITAKTATALYNFTNWLEKRMKDTDTTDAELAQFVGCDRKTILKIRHGEYYPKLDQLVLFFDYFDKNWVQIPFYKDMEDYGN